MAAPKRTVEDFRQQYDKSIIVPQKIKAALAELGDSWEVEGDFIKRCKLSQPDFGAYKEQFADHVVTARMPGGALKRVWAGTTKFAAKLREHVTP